LSPKASWDDEIANVASEQTQASCEVCVFDHNGKGASRNP